MGIPGFGSSLRSSATSAIRSGLAPRTVFVPDSTVIGRSVVSRSVKQRTPSADVSSWTPPESVTTTRASASRPRKERYGERLGDQHAGVDKPPREPGALDSTPCAWMHGEDHTHASRKAYEPVNRGSELLGVVYERGAMERDEGIGPGAQIERFPGPLRPRGSDECEEGVDHRVADNTTSPRTPSRARLTIALSECTRRRSLT